MSIQNLAGQMLGQYQLKELLGVGGMGAVYRGYQSNLQRDVAVKVMSPELVTQPDYIERFYREARTAAALEHTHIVPVHDYGVQGDISYVVMRLLTGGTLMDRLAQQAETGKTLPALAETAEILKQLASALDYAHSKGVIHRDIKPSNVMFDNQASAYLVDFGIAKLVTASRAITSAGVLMGTPLFMPPEQWRAEEVTHATDQYALGVMIYALVAGRVPFEADTPHGLMYKHLNEIPTPPQTYRPDTPEEVTQVLKRALAKDPAARFPTVTAFAQAFEKAIRGAEGGKTNFFSAPLRRTQRARPAQMAVSSTFTDRPARSMAASPVLWAGGGLAVLAALVMVVFLLSRGSKNPTEPPQHLIETAAAQTIVAMNLTATANAPTAAPSPAATSTQAATAHLPTETPEVVMMVITNTLYPASEVTEALLPTQIPPIILPETQVWLDLSATARQWTPTDTATPTVTPNYTATYAAYRVFAEQTLTAQSWTDTPTVTWTPSPTPTNTSTPTNTPTPSDTPTLTSTSPPTFTRTPTLTPTPVLINMAQPPAESIISPGNAAQLTSWTSIDTGDLFLCCGMAFSPDGKQLAVSESQSVVFYDLQTMQIIQKVTLNGWSVALAFSPDWKLMATYARYSGPIQIWDVATYSNLQTINLNGVTGVAFSADGKLLAAAAEQAVKILDAQTGSEITTLTAQNAYRFGELVFSPDGQTLAVSAGDALYLWDTTNWQREPQVVGEGDYGYQPAFSPDGKRLAWLENDMIHVYDLPSGHKVRSMTYTTSVSSSSGSLAFSPDGQVLAATTESAVVKLWNMNDGRELGQLVGHTDMVTTVLFSPNGTAIASSSEDGTVRLWGLPTIPAVKATPTVTPTLAYTLTAAPTPTYTPTSTPTPIPPPRITADNAAQIDQSARIQQDWTWVEDIAWSPEGNTLAISANAAGVWLYNGQDFTAAPRFVEHEYWPGVTTMAWSPDGTRLALGDSQDTIHVMDAYGGTVLFVLKGHADFVEDVAFSPDGTLLASASSDRTVRLWDMTTGKEIRLLEGHEGGVDAIAWSPDGTQLVSGSQDSTARIWDVATAVTRQTLKMEYYAVDKVDWSGDGMLIAAGGYDGVVVWDAATGQQRYAMASGLGIMGAVAFSPDGLILATSHLDNAVHLWDMTTGSELIALARHTGLVTGIVWSPDGARLATMSGDGTVRVWNVPPK